jgi:CheY-like chemotaxis protein
VKRPILVVEDDAAVRDTLVTALEGDGYTVISTDDGATALDMISQQRPALVLLDLVMPRARVDGFEFLARLGRSPEGRAVPVVVTSGLASVVRPVMTREMATALNVVGVIGKPFDLSELLATVRLARPAAS